MPNPNRVFTITYNLMLDERTDAQLIALANRHDMTKAQVCRQGIRNWAIMDELRSPTCSNGQKCLCPHAHIWAPSNPAPHPDQPAPDHGRP
ncbi:hypothetical protein LCGC14_1225150 [marine sediment metagenome]|uniref:CopG family transcriptional regulator n=1 Tax=marine sediment metagenome TaxID=412755 RepID=A0A0F9LXD5_9ZZZZ